MVLKKPQSVGKKFKIKNYYTQTLLQRKAIVTNVLQLYLRQGIIKGKSFEELLEKVPDEFYNWVKKTQSELRTQFDNILTESKAVFNELETRKETALYFQTQKHPSILFSMLNKKTPDKIIWKMIRPKYSKPFKTDEV